MRVIVGVCGVHVELHQAGDYNPAVLRDLADNACRLMREALVAELVADHSRATLTEGQP